MTLRVALLCGLIATTPLSARALSWTETIAEQGRPWQAPPHLAEDVAALANDPLRLGGSRFFFSELPNDVVTFGYLVRAPEDVQYLVTRFATLEHRPLTLRISPKSGRPVPLGRPSDEAIAFTFGDQRRLDEWFGQLPGGRVDANGITHNEFGVWKLAGPPAATPPTLILYAGHPNVDLSKLTIPAHVTVESSVSAEARKDPAQRAGVQEIDRIVEARRPDAREPRSR